jgi:MATE family multidrug resistance protein
MSLALTIKSKHSYHERHLEASGLLSPPSRSFSPIAHEILVRDLADYFADESERDDDYKCSDFLDLDDATATHDHSLISGSNGIAYGTLRPIVAAEAPASPGLSTRNITRPRTPERSTLHDGHILPKDPQPLAEPLWKQLYRRCFTTKGALDAGPLLSAASTKSPEIETTPLLQHTYKHPRRSLTPATHDQLPNHGPTPTPPVPHTTWQLETATLTSYSRSLIITFLLHYSVTITSIFTVGRLGRLELGAVSLATMTANITCYAPFQGLSTCLDTLCAQAYGSGHKHLVGLQLQRVTFLLWMLLLPVAGLWWYSGRVLGVMIPNGETARLAGVYLRVLVLGTPGVAAFESGKRFVQAQGLFRATTWVLLVGAPVNVVANWYVGFFSWAVGPHGSSRELS